MSRLLYGRRWGVKEIAANLEYSERYTRERIVHHPDFPKPIIAISRKKRKWLSDDVIAFAKKERDFALKEEK